MYMWPQSCDNVLNCLQTIAFVEDLSNFAVRLINSIGNNSNEGRLEIYYSGSWGTVCGDRFTDENARVACASLRYG